VPDPVDRAAVGRRPRAGQRQSPRADGELRESPLGVASPLVSTCCSLQGGSYFSNGIALNTIESHPSPGKETWANINAIDDIVEFLMSDMHLERSGFMSALPAGQSLCQRGIITVACMRGNAAAGGVALASACDITVAASGLVLNPAYRAMGLHGSEFHS